MTSARVLLAGLTVLLLVGQGMAQEDDKARLKDIVAKKKAGQELTPDERAFLEQNARFMKKPKGEFPGAPEGLKPPPQIPSSDHELQILLAQLNVVDRAALSAVQQLWDGGRRDEAIALAEKIAGKTPDTDAAGVARLMLGRFLTKSGRAEEAGKHLRVATGRAAALAMVELAQPAMKARDVPGLLAAFKDLLASQKNSLDRCRVLKALLDFLDRPTLDPWPPEQRAELLQALANSIPYEDALAAKEALAEEKPLVPVTPDPQAFAPGQGPGPKGGPPLPPEMQERFRAIRDLPPDQRHEAMGALMKDVARQVEQLRAAGREEEARRLAEMLERHEQMEGRMKEMMKKGKGPGLPPPRDPAVVRAEIKRLEDQGFMDEAKKLRRQLEERQPGQAVDDRF